jgi:hypothetical protein
MPSGDKIARVARRLAAILAIDMVGFSRLMEADEAGTIARQRAHRREHIDPTLREHGGRIVKTTGDGLLVEFGSVVDAVDSAVRIQRAIAEAESAVPKDRRIQYRAGINLGDIVIDGDDILGDGVNIAAASKGSPSPAASPSPPACSSRSSASSTSSSTIPACGRSRTSRSRCASTGSGWRWCATKRPPARARPATPPSPASPCCRSRT